MKNMNKLYKFFMQKYNNVIVDRIDDKYYITEGHLAIEINPRVYLEEFLSKSGLFKELENRERLVFCTDNSGKSEKVQFYPSISKLFNALESSYEPAEKTELELRETSMFIVDGEFQFVPAGQIAMIESIIPNANWSYSTERKHFRTCGQDISVIVMSCPNEHYSKLLTEILAGGGYHGKAV